MQREERSAERPKQAGSLARAANAGAQVNAGAVAEGPSRAGRESHPMPAVAEAKNGTGERTERGADLLRAMRAHAQVTAADRPPSPAAESGRDDGDPAQRVNDPVRELLEALPPPEARSGDAAIPA